MAEESGSLFCDEDETCEKNTSESDEDGEEYVSAPLGNLRIALFLSIRWLQLFPLSFSHPRLSPCFVVILYISTSRLLEKPFYCTAMCAFFNLNFIYSCFSFADKLGPCGRWLRHRLLSSILIGTPPLVALQVKFSFFSTRLNRRRFKLVRYFTCLLFVFSILLTFKLTLAKSRLLDRCVLSILQRSLCFDLIIR